MGNYSVPTEIRAMKPVGTCVKNIKGHFYVYEQRNEKCQDGKWHRKSGNCIGKIEYGIGFVSNKPMSYEEDITTLEYGQYAVAVANTSDVLQRLLRHFNKEDAHRIYIMSVIHAVNSFRHRKVMAEYFEQCYLSLIYPSLSFSERSISELVDSLGRKQIAVQEFEQELIDESSGKIAIDGHVIVNCSHNDDIAAFGNKYRAIKDMQMNLLMAYDIKYGNPVFSKIYEGGTLDKVSVKDLLGTYSFKDTLFIVDRDFYSNDNLTLFSTNGNKYIIPLSENLDAYKQATSDMSMSDTFVYERNGKRNAIEYRENIICGRRAIVYRDTVQNAIEAADYRKCIGVKGTCTEEKYQEMKEFFGTIVIQTTLGDSAEEIYGKYKERWTIETFYDHFKNDLDFNALYEQDYYKLEGMSFIMLITGLVYEDLHKASNNVKGKTLDDCLLAARFVKIHHEKNKWVKTNMKRSIQELLTQLNVDYLSDIP